MGESHSVDEFAAKIVAGGVAINGAVKKGVQSASLAAKTTILTSAAPDTGGDMRLSRWRSGKGIKIDAGYKVDDMGVTVKSVVKPRPVGVWSLLEHGAVQHSIVPGARKKQRRAGRTLLDGVAGPVLPGTVLASGRTKKQSGRVLSFGPGQVAAYATHPGTSGKNTWSRGATAAKPIAVEVFQRTHRAALIGAFR